jgi:putative membrane protein
MKIRPTIPTHLFLPSAAALSLALVLTVQAQNAPVTLTNPNGSASDSKSADSGVAQQHDASVSTTATSSSALDTSNSKDTTNSLDKNPSTASTDSADKSATKDPTMTNANDQTSKEKSSSERFSDRHFLVKAAEGGMAEVELGKIAQEKASSPNVKQFGAHMVADHSKANEELKGIAQQKGVSIPAKLDARHQATVDRLNKLSGPDFDRAYVNDMVADHQKDVAEFEKASSSAQDPDVKAFAGKTLTVIKSHLADVQSLQSQLK